MGHWSHRPIKVQKNVGICLISVDYNQKRRRRLKNRKNLFGEFLNKLIRCRKKGYRIFLLVQK